MSDEYSADGLEENSTQYPLEEFGLIEQINYSRIWWRNFKVKIEG